MNIYPSGPNAWHDNATNDDVDCHGVPFIGIDDDGMWVGTPNALSVIGDPSVDEWCNDGPPVEPSPMRAWCVMGQAGALPFTGHYVASCAAYPYQRAISMGITEIEVIGGGYLPDDTVAEPFDFVLLSDDECWCRACEYHIAECGCAR